ncbi:hypothetical protein [Paenibacillus jilunlii]|uniref:hypothetical protein n=1 Tax=Paenibacillus jilunlii TaxID=682956 RepID=UPI000784905A|nr:hypothetical protein [Paenibacillus jilunlii]
MNENLEDRKNDEQQIKDHRRTSDEGEVVLMPMCGAVKDLPDFFELLGKMSDLEKQNNGLEEGAGDGIAYGITTTVNYAGMIYNNQVPKDA